jgi:methionine-rich copper-binding protein CopC
MKPTRLVSAVTCAFALLVIVAVEVSAHSFPQEQSPAAGQTVATAPSAVSIKYDAPIEHLFAKLEVIDESGNNVAVGQPDLGSDGRTLSIKVSSLKPGEYTVKWSVVCIDTHRTQGSYSFSVAGQGS